jgi:hypothetical protein
MNRTIATVAVALGLAVTASACSDGGGAQPAHRNSPSSPPPSVFGPRNAKLGRTGLVSDLPDTCQAVKSSLPAGMANAFLMNSFEAPVDEFQECVWSSLSDTSARVFRYGFWQYNSRAQAHEIMSDLERDNEFEDDDCRFTAATKRLFGLGEEAFIAPCTYKKYDSIRPESNHVYEVGGANLIFRTRNVVIRLWWVAADYTPSESKNSSRWLRGGKKLSYDEARPQALQVAKAVLTHFP